MMAMLAVMNLVELACDVGAIYFSVVASCMSIAVFACGLSLIRAIDGSLANRHTQTLLRTQGLGNTNTRDEQDLRLLATRKSLKLAIGSILVLMSMASALLLFGSVTPYGAEGPILFFAAPLDILPTIWFEINLWLHCPKRIEMLAKARDIARANQLSHISHPWSAPVSALAVAANDEAKWRGGHAFGRENGKGSVVVPTEETTVRPMVVVGSDSS